MRHAGESAKRPINLSLNAEVLDAAKALGMNISQTVDQLLTNEVRRRYHEQWNIDNREAIAAYNARIEREGTFSQRIRAHLAADADVEPAAR